MRRTAARLCTILVCLTGAAAIQAAAPAWAAVPGFAVQITELPGEFAAGGGPETLTVVASQTEGDRCVKVRWSMLMEVSGFRIDQVGVERLEDDGAFPLTVRAEGDRARLTDVRLDPGTLCPDRTVTARYRVSVAEEATAGTVSFQAEAYDADERLLQLATARRDVSSGELVPTPSPTVSDDADDAPAGGAVAEPPPPAEAGAAAGPQRNTGAPVGQSLPSSDSGLAKVGLVVGGLFIFLGVGLLLRLRRRTAAAGAEPTGRLAAYRRRRYS